LKILARDVRPERSSTDDLGTPNTSASARRASSVARPSTAGAATPTTISSPSHSMPGLERGLTRTLTRTPPAVSVIRIEVNVTIAGQAKGDDGNE